MGKVYLVSLFVATEVILSLNGFLLPPDVKDTKLGCPPFCLKELCSKNLNCKNGVVKDECGCCDVCLKDEGDACGGPHQIDGICQKELFCSKRHIMSHRNVFIPFLKDKYGKCEPAKCKNFDCGRHQWCKVVDNKPTCYCRESCQDETLPVCGKTNGITYQSHCHLRAEECKTQQKIDLFIGKCKPCTDNESGKSIESGRSYKTGKKCEKRVCINGRFSRYMDEECLKKEGFSCTMNSGIHDDVKCKQDTYCVIKEKSGNLENYPDLGVCNPLSAEHCYYHGQKYVANEYFFGINCKSRCRCIGLNSYECVPLCPKERIICGKDEISSSVKEKVEGSEKCTCPRQVCIKKSDVCKMRKETGDCFGLITRWYHDVNDGKCKKFTYGGCQGNKNNFHSKKACEDLCVPEDDVTKPIVKPESVGAPLAYSVGRYEDSPHWPEAKGQILPRSNTDMTVNGHVKLLGKNQILPKGSCIKISLRDITLLDVSATILKETIFLIPDFNTAKELFSFSMTTKKPIFSSKDVFSVVAKVYKGKCKSGHLEYYTDVQHEIRLDDKLNEYKIDIYANYQGKEPLQKSPPKVINPETRIVRSSNSNKDPAFEDEMLPDEGGWPEGEGEGPRLSNKTMTVSGNIVFPFKPGRLIDSCLTITIADITLKDVSSFTIASETIRFSNYDMQLLKYPYTIKATKPVDDDLNREISISAVLNRGWCSDKNSESGTRDEDFFTDTIFRLPITPFSDNVTQDFNLICTGCDELEINSTEITEVLSDDEGWPDGEGEGPRLSNKTMTVSGNIVFPFKPGRLIDSCLTITISDNTLQDVSSFTMVSETIKFSNYDMQVLKYPYTIKTTKPIDDDLNRDIAISAKLNRGWCPEKSGTRDKDFVTDTFFRLPMTPFTDNVTRNFFLVCTGCDEEEINATEITYPKLSNKTMTIKGDIEFKREPGKMSDGSCLYITLADVTYASHAAFILYDKVMDVSNQVFGSKYKYTITTKKPVREEFYRKFDVTATLHSGWCPKPDAEPWVKEGDYMSKYLNPLTLDERNIFKGRNIRDVFQIEKTKDVDTNWDRSLQEYNKEDVEPPLEKDSEGSENDIRTIFTSNNNEMTKGDNSSESTPPKQPAMNDGTASNAGKCYDETTKTTYENGVWLKRMSENDNPCTSCKCNNGKIICSPDFCPDLDCLGEVFTIPGNCCSSCKNPDQCYVEQFRKIFDHNSTFITSTCGRCVCLNGKVTCQFESCNEKPGNNKGDKTKMSEGTTDLKTKMSEVITEVKNATQKLDCIDDGKISRKHGETWLKDSCRSCTCAMGRVTCFKKICKSCKEHEYSVKSADDCCPICKPKILPNKCYDKNTNRYYSHNETFSFKDGCTKCHCSYGNLYCISSLCSYPSCPEGDTVINREGICCPVCSSKNICMDNKKKYVEGNIWQNENCDICSCEKNGIECRMPNYSVNECKHVVRISHHCQKICLEDFKKKTTPTEDP